VNADRLAYELGIDAYLAAQMANNMREDLVRQQESFAFETVLSDPVGDKVGFLKRSSENGYNVVLCYIGLASADLSAERVAMRVTQGGHDVPDEKIASRLPRTLANLKAAIAHLPRVLVYDNSDLAQPYRQVGVFENGVALEIANPLPIWLGDLLS
jgi:predicted ABC-type ATPase